MKKLISLMLVWFALGIVGSTIAGYVFDWQWLVTWNHGTPMAINTATAIAALALAMLLRHKGRKERRTDEITMTDNQQKGKI